MIDYEYSGNNDPCFELGNIWSECGLSTDQLDELVTAITAVGCATRSPAPTCRASSQSTADPVGLYPKCLQRT